MPENERSHPVGESVPAVDPAPTGAECAWCGAPLSDDDSFWLRVGARLCPRCADEAGRIAAEQAKRSVTGE